MGPGVTDRLRGWLELGAVVALGLVGFFLIQEYGARKAAEAQQEPLRRAADAARQEAAGARQAAEAALARADSASAALGASAARGAALEDSLRTALRGDSVRVNEAVTELDAIFVEIRRVAPEVTPLVDRIEIRTRELTALRSAAVAAFENEARSFAAFRAQTEATLTEKDAALGASQAEAERWRVAYLAEQARADNAERLMTRGLWDRVMGSLPFFSMEGTVAGVIGLGAGVLLTR